MSVSRPKLDKKANKHSKRGSGASHDTHTVECCSVVEWCSAASWQAGPGYFAFCFHCGLKSQEGYANVVKAALSHLSPDDCPVRFFIFILYLFPGMEDKQYSPNPSDQDLYNVIKIFIHWKWNMDSLNLWKLTFPNVNYYQNQRLRFRQTFIITFSWRQNCNYSLSAELQPFFLHTHLCITTMSYSIRHSFTRDVLLTPNLNLLLWTKRLKCWHASLPRPAQRGHSTLCNYL